MKNLIRWDSGMTLLLKMNSLMDSGVLQMILSVDDEDGFGDAPEDDYYDDGDF